MDSDLCTFDCLTVLSNVASILSLTCLTCTPMSYFHFLLYDTIFVCVLIICILILNLNSGILTEVCQFCSVSLYVARMIYIDMHLEIDEFDF